MESAFSARSIALSTCCHQLSRAVPYEFTHNRVTRSLCDSIVGEAGFLLAYGLRAFFPPSMTRMRRHYAAGRPDRMLTPRDVSIRSENQDLSRLDTLWLSSLLLACARILLSLSNELQVRQEQMTQCISRQSLIILNNLIYESCVETYVL